jgi:hypothetical protein
MAVWAIGQLIAAALSVLFWIATTPDVLAAVTVDDLVRRVQIPLAAISPDGRFAAYFSVRGNPIPDLYDAAVRVVDLQKGTASVVLSEYQLAPSETFDEFENLQPSAGNLMWTKNGVLIYLTRSGGTMRLESWNSHDHTRTVLDNGHDRIAFDLNVTSSNVMTLITTDFVDRSAVRRTSVVDNAWRVRDDYRFHGPLNNPKTSRWTKKRKWSLALDSLGHLTPQEPATEAWEILPEEWINPVSTTSATNADDTITYLRDETPAPNGALTAMVEDATLNLQQPGKSYSSSRIIVMEGERKKILTPFARPRPELAVLGWSPDGQGVYYVNVGARESTISVVNLAGKITELHREPAELQRPCLFYGSRCQALSHDGRSALLVRSTNVMPAELIKIDLMSKGVSVLDSPNDVFLSGALPSIRLYSTEIAGADVHGRLYLPLSYQEGIRYPMVITQYVSRPGYPAAVGDEVPILALTANGIAVFAMHSQELNRVSRIGDFRMEIDRVQRPLDGMQWIYRRLVAEGIVDADRVGLTGLSYGSEIAMYAYWKTKIFRAVSSTTASWDPSLMLFGGVGYASSLESRGFPQPHGNDAMRLWRELSAGLNANAELPPLLLQSPDAEETLTVPTWFQLRRVGAPVEWYEYPNEGHVKRSPANKWWVFERNLDWFRFWLKDEEDNNPEKREQYQRWRSLRSRTSTQKTQ